VARRPISFIADTDIFIDYLNGFERMREILDSPCTGFTSLQLREKNC